MNRTQQTSVAKYSYDVSKAAAIVAVAAPFTEKVPFIVFVPYTLVAILAFACGYELERYHT